MLLNSKERTTILLKRSHNVYHHNRSKTFESHCKAINLKENLYCQRNACWIYLYIKIQDIFFMHHLFRLEMMRQIWLEHAWKVSG